MSSTFLIMLYKVLLTLDKIIKCARKNENYLLCCTRLYLLMSASSQKMLSKNRPEEKKKIKSNRYFHLSSSRSKEGEQLWFSNKP